MLCVVALLVAAATAARVPSASAHPADPPPAGLVPGNLLVAASVYQTDPNIVVGTPLGPTCGTTPYNTPCGHAVTNGDYPLVFNNGSVDGNFGVTSPIVLDQLTPAGALVNSLEVPNSSQAGVTATSDQMVTSFSSKSELALNLSTDGNQVTFMGYLATVDAADVSNANTPGVIDPTNPDAGAYDRVVAALSADGSFHFTLTNAYSGDNGRAAILNAEQGANLIYAAGNAGGGANPEPAGVVLGAGAQLIAPSDQPESAQAPGQPTPVGAFNVRQLGDKADKSAKDTNFRGLTIFNNVLYYTKGSGGNGVDTLYFVDPTGTACPNGTGLPEPGAALPTSSTPAYSTSSLAFGLSAKNPGLVPPNMCILAGFPTALAKGATDASDYPFGVWFANPSTLYIADEGSGDNTYAAGSYTAAAASTTAGLQKWVLDAATRQWNLAYTLQAGLGLGQPYTVAGYPTGDNSGPGGTGLPWAPATDGLRNLTGHVNPDGTVTITAATSTVSGSGDQGADPNAVVQITDTLGSASLPAGEQFQTLLAPTSGTVYRGVSYTPGTGASQPANVTCAGGTYTDTTIGGNVTVPAGSTCTLADVTVDGNVTVDAGGSLLDTASTINGNLRTSGAAWVAIRGGQVAGSVDVQGTTGTPVVGDASTANDLCGVAVGGNVLVDNNGARASFDVGAAPDCATPLLIAGHLDVELNGAKVAIGPAGDGSGNTAQGGIQVTGNAGGGSLTDNTTAGKCELDGNTPPIVGTSNTAAGPNSCNSTA
jgi:hypothetical protein